VNDNEMQAGPNDRRELLKKLGIAAGALAWTTPIVQTISTKIAGAQEREPDTFTTTTRRATTTTRPTTTTTRPTTTTTRPTTTTTRPTTTTTRPTTTTTRPVTTTTAAVQCHDISHLDLIVQYAGSSTKYGIQWDPGSGWSKHSTTSKHCLENQGTWSQPPDSAFVGAPTPVAIAGGSYRLTLPVNVTVVGAWSKAGQECQPAVNLGGTTWQFDKWCSGPTTTTTSSTTTTRPTTTSTTRPTTTTTISGDDCDDKSTDARTYEVDFGGKTGGTTTTTAASGQCHDISHLDLIIQVSGSSTKYGVQWDPGEGWSKHSTSSQHCLAGQSWTQPSSSVYSSFPTPTAISGGSYRVTLPVNITVVAAYSKAGQECQPAVNQGGNTWRFDKWCSGPTTTTSTTRPTTTTTRATTTTSTTRPTTTTSTTRPTTTTSTTRPTSTTTTSTTRPTTTTTAAGGGEECGSPAPGKDISHMDWIVSRGGDRYGVQYDFGGGWGAHPSSNTSSQHCLAGLSWRVPPTTFSFSGFGNAVSLGGGAYRITVPADVTVHDAFSKCGQVCRRATHLGGNTWRFDPC
jgi:hypothetical protein